MKPSAPLFHPLTGVDARRAMRGFTLLGVMLGLLALVLAAYIANGEYRKYQRRAQIDRFVGDLRTFAGVFETYRQQKKVWPAATNPDIRIPLGMESFLAATPWQAGPPFGGTYEWHPPHQPLIDEADLANKPAGGVVLPAFIAVTAFSPLPPLRLTAEELRSIDARLDDGNLATGRFRTGFNGWPLYRIEQKR